MNTISPPNGAIPFLKWPGGKRWLAHSLAETLPRRFGTYIEPFLGSGAVFFALAPHKAVLGDLNADLVGVYQGIKNDWRGVLRRLQAHHCQHGKSHYYAVRDTAYKASTARAAQFLYLNRTCFNGIYRVNRQGHFNVPIGSKSSVVLPTDDFQAISALLRSAELVCSDFEPLIDRAGRGDLVFADPPYTVRHNSNAFVKYNEKLFSWADQVRLANALERARKRKAKIVLTNANHPSVRSLYAGRGFTLDRATRFSPIAASAEGRGRYSELIVTANL